MSLKCIHLLLLLFFSSFVFCQTPNWIKNPIYTDGILAKEATILYNKEECIIIDKDGIRPFHSIIDHFSTDFLRKTIVKIHNKIYLLQDDFTVNLDEGIDIDLDALSDEGEKLAIVGNAITYIANDSVFVDNFKRPRKTFVTKGMVPILENEKYLLLEKKQNEVYYIFDMSTRKLKKLPSHGEHFSTINEYFIVYQVFNQFGVWGDWNIEVLDRGLNKVVDKSDGYDNKSSNANYLTINGSSTKPKYWYKGQQIKLPLSVERVELLLDSGISSVRNNKNKEGLMNGHGKIIYPYQFDYYVGSEKPIKGIHGVNRNNTCMFDEYGKIIFEADYHTARYVCEDRFEIGKYLVNVKKKVIVEKKDNGFFVFRNEYGKDYIIECLAKSYYNLYTMDGDLIINFQSTRHEPKCYTLGHPGYSWEMIRSLTQQQLDEFNPSDFWIRDIREFGNRYFKVENHNGKQLTTRYKYLKNYYGSNIFVAKTLDDRYGVLKIEN